MGVSEFSLINWEKGCEPSDRSYPTIIRFLDAEPWPTPVTLAERLRAARRRRGLAAKTVARLIGVDEESVRRWEATGRIRHRAALEKVLRWSS